MKHVVVFYRLELIKLLHRYQRHVEESWTPLWCSYQTKGKSYLLCEREQSDGENMSSIYT
jgi:hypothetical protein